MKRWLGGLAVVALVWGCGGDEGWVDDGGDAAASPAGPCDDEPRAEAWAPGMAHSDDAGVLTVALLESEPEPSVKGDHRWVLQLTDADGAPLSGLAPEVRPFMPDHGHGATVDPVVTPLDAPGTYAAEPVELFMPGLWEVRVGAEMDGAFREVLFSFCVTG